MTRSTPIRRRPDGSIDTAYYISEGHVCRSQAAHRLARTTAHPYRRFLSLAALFALLPFAGGQN